MPHGDPKKMLNARIDSGLYDWLVEYAEETDQTRTQVIEELLFGLREGRVLVRPRGPDPFPKEARPAGSTPSNPIHIAYHREPQP